MLSPKSLPPGVKVVVNNDMKGQFIFALSLRKVCFYLFCCMEKSLNGSKYTVKEQKTESKSIMYVIFIF